MTRKLIATVAATALTLSSMVAVPAQAREHDDHYKPRYNQPQRGDRHDDRRNDYRHDGRNDHDNRPSSKSSKNNDAAKIIVGATAIYLLGKAIQENNRQQQQPHYAPQPQYQPHYQPRPYRPQPVLAVPGHCLINTYVNGYSARGFSAACAEDYASIPNRLPQSCLQRTDGRQGPRFIYRLVCMQQQGWQVA